MKKIDLGQKIQILANVGVLVGILLLVYELNQNRKMMEAQTRQAVAQSSIDVQLRIADNPALVNAIIKDLNGEDLTPQEAFIRERQLSAVWRSRENTSYQYRRGLYDSQEYLRQRQAWVGSLNQAGPMREFFCAYATSMSEEFVQEMNQLTDEPCGAR